MFSMPEDTMMPAVASKAVQNSTRITPDLEWYEANARTTVEVTPTIIKTTLFSTLRLLKLACLLVCFNHVACFRGYFMIPLEESRKTNRISSTD